VHRVCFSHLPVVPCDCWGFLRPLRDFGLICSTWPGQDMTDELLADIWSLGCAVLEMGTVSSVLGRRCVGIRKAVHSGAELSVKCVLSYSFTPKTRDHFKPNHSFVHVCSEVSSYILPRV
jgi:hypothetical protein